MREIQIRLNLPDQEQVNPLGQTLENIIVTMLGVKMRQGSTLFKDSTSSAQIDGIFHWQEQSRIIVASGGSVFSISEGTPGVGEVMLFEDGVEMLFEDGQQMLFEPVFSVADVSNDALVSGTRVKFANFGSYLYMANGNKIKELHPSTSQVSYDDGGGSRDYTCLTNNINSAPATGGTTDWQDDGLGSTHTAWSATTRYGSGKADDLEDASWPTTVSHIGVADKYLLAIEDNSQRMHYSYPDEPWRSDGDFVSAEHLPEDANSLVVADGDVWVGGRQSIQQFQNTATTAWSPSSYGAFSAGVLAPYSFIYAQGGFFWIDEKRRFVTLNGRVATPLNRSIDTYINSVSTVTDAISDWFVIDGTNFILLQFPSSNKSIQINLDNGSWSEVTNGDNRIDISAIINVPDWDYVLAGDTGNGYILDVGTKYRQDNGTAISAKIRTPRMQIDNSATRLIVGSIALALTKLTTSQEQGSSSFTVRWRDDTGDWNGTRTFTISDDTVTDLVAHLWRCGSYRTNRQYEIDISSLYPYSIQRMTEQ